jgi:hypothetical protein
LFIFIFYDSLYRSSLSTALSPRLQITTRRLGAAAASGESSAAHGFSISHDKFMRVTAAVAPNRKL